MIISPTYWKWWTRNDVIFYVKLLSLQLETIKEEIIGFNPKTQKVIKDKLYNDLKPVITLIWMVDDNLGFEEDFVTYQMAVKKLNDFVKNDDLWSKSFESLLDERKKVLNLENNDTRGLNFISQNKLSFIFQQNIVENNKNNEKLKKYVKWFDFALKTKNKKNKKSDFKKFEKDKLFVVIMNRLIKNKLTDDEIQYISESEEFKNAYSEYTAKIIKMKQEVETLKQKAQEEKQKAQEEKQKAQEDMRSIIEQQKKAIIRLHKKGFSIKDLSVDFGIKEKDIKEVLKNL